MLEVARVITEGFYEGSSAARSKAEAGVLFAFKRTMSEEFEREVSGVRALP